ncbi:MAG: hypothetical protein WBV39_00605 [Rudaea sp.]
MSRQGAIGNHGAKVPDILVRNIDDAIAERIKAIARERDWSINEVIVHVLRHSLGLGGEDVAQREIHDVAMLGGTWDPREADAFRNALEAFEQVDGKPLFTQHNPGKDQSPK